jgi:two-component system phosphate regulon sensor histidine kinase PhoR
MNVFEEEMPDVVITVSATDSRDISCRLDTQSTPINYRPLLVRIAEDLSADFSDECADVILGPYPRAVERHLQTLLDMRTENALLSQKIQTLEDDAAHFIKALEKQKRLSLEAEILKDAIVRNVSHELKTPLLQVKSAVALIAEGIENRELVNYAKGATGRLETLVKNITLLGSSLDVNPGPVLVRETVEYAIRNLGRFWEHGDDVERIRTSYEKKLPPALADKQGLTTVLQLLMDNALKFSKDAIEVVVDLKGNDLQFGITDYGIGIAKDQLDSIFDMFYQIDPSSTRRYGGTGIGLAIVRLILDHHETRIKVDSQVGKGSTFSFILPAAKL